jgi:uncharacterized protein YxeA
MGFKEIYNRFNEVLQWTLITLTLILCAVILVRNGNAIDESENLRRENSYIKIYSSQRAAELSKKNKELNDSILILNEKLEKYNKEKKK